MTIYRSATKLEEPWPSGSRDLSRRLYGSSPDRGNSVCDSLGVLEVTRDQIWARLKWDSGRSLSQTHTRSILHDAQVSGLVRGCILLSFLPPPLSSPLSVHWSLSDLAVGQRAKDRAARNVRGVSDTNCKAQKFANNAKRVSCLAHSRQRKCRDPFSPHLYLSPCSLSISRSVYR